MTEQPGARDPKQLRASDADRERVAQVLHNAMGEGRITMAELEERLGTVYGAKTLGELEPVLEDLPGIQPAPQPGQLPVVAQQALPPEARIGGKPGSTTSIAIMSGATRKGNWVLPPQHNSFAFWGGTEIDLRKARFAEKHSTITAVAIMGGVEITVPDDIHVEVTGIGFMGAFETVDKKNARPEDEVPADAPTVKINGFAFWGAVEIKRLPREPKKKQIEQ
ncbi:DUF1707 SHOCT-like domain-containing protein [Prauserella cavernicola]|uniref:DUF1707 and DUF2154 domain-containing protein n=1 Tax=Prauserella cavernicola TaxID=2800127 RepID=A0A934QW31_9PSEU|nr:DUF1707 domain-containing protein [Prauserella cavernicola]MBK1789337.1 DUF1707 and DUF2154 domain-containing protein [Prauserella cavernicola]